MRRLAVMVLAAASASWAMPIAFTGTSTVGSDAHNLFLNGINSGFQFGNATPGWSIFFTFCDWDSGPCELSYRFFVQSDASFGASDGSTLTGSNGVTGPTGGPPGFADGLVTWTAKPLTTPPEMIVGPGGTPTATVVVPITLFGELRAWTPEELASHSGPFFDYQISASGTLTALFYGTIDNVLTANAEFTGTATPIPEPATWCLVVALGLILRGRSRVRGTYKP